MNTPGRLRDHDLVFHIVFAPGTVCYLRLATLSLLEFSPYRYRLVANGLPRDELNQLKRFCDIDPRLEFLAYPTPTMLFHATVLTLLERQNTGEFFCFADSDIFATEPFHEELSAELAECDVFSAGGRIGFSDAERKAGIAGPLVHTETGLPLASTFFAVYRSELLSQVITQTGVSFERYACREHIPDLWLDWLQDMGISQEKFDTGKLMNILGQRFGMRIRYRDLDMLHHIGGLTQGFMHTNLSRRQRGKTWLRNRLTGGHPYGLSKSLGGAQKRRIEVGCFFALYLRALFDERDLPEIPASLSVDGRIRRTCEVISRLFDRYHDRLKD